MLGATTASTLAGGAGAGAAAASAVEVGICGPARCGVSTSVEAAVAAAALAMADPAGTAGASSTALLKTSDKIQIGGLPGGAAAAGTPMTDTGKAGAGERGADEEEPPRRRKTKARSVSLLILFRRCMRSTRVMFAVEL